MKNYTNINIGCGDRLTKGYLNFNSSLSVRLSKLPYFIIELIYLLNLIAVQHYNYIKFLKKNLVLYCDAWVKIPLSNESVDNIYFSHTFEHFNFEEADLVLKEFMRVLKPGETTLKNLGDLDLKERNEAENMSLYIEAKKNGKTYYDKIKNNN